MFQIQNLLTEIIVNVLLALLTLAAGYGTLFVKKTVEKLQFEAQKLQKEEQIEMATQALKRVEEVAKLTVNKLEQTTAKAIRSAVKEGKKDKEELKQLAIVAYHEVKNVLEPEYLALLESSLGDAQGYILNVIEDQLVEIKNRDGSFGLEKVS